jgi:peptide/nickel transport system permease protein
MLGESASPADVGGAAARPRARRPARGAVRRVPLAVARGDLGVSITYRAPVVTVIASRYGATLELAGAAALVAVGFALPLGLLAASRPRSLADRLRVS